MAATAVVVTAMQGAGERVLEAKLGALGKGNSPGQTLVFGGASVTRGKGALDEELHIRGSSVAWTAGGVLRKQVTAQGPILRAAWCYFQNTGPDAILCLLHPAAERHAAALSCFTQDGDSHVIPLPGAFTGLWPLPQGVLLTGAPAQGPCILVHPLEDIQPVHWRGSNGEEGATGGMGAGSAVGGTGAGTGGQHGGSFGAGGGVGGWDADERVVWSGVEVPYLVTHNTRHGRLSLWSIATLADSQGFVCVTPMRFPAAAPRTPVGTMLPPQQPGLLGTTGALPMTQAYTQQMLATPPQQGQQQGGAGGRPGGAGTYKKASLRLPNGCLSPMAFNPAPRSNATPTVSTATAAGGSGAAAGAPGLRLPSQELPISFSLLWEQPIEPGMGGPAAELEGHLATDTNGDLLLCLLSRSTQRLTALRLPPPPAAAAAPMAARRRVEVAFSLPAVAVAAVSATLHAGGSHSSRQQHEAAGGGEGSGPPPRDLLVLQPDGRLGLHAGGRRLCTVALPAGDDGGSGAAAPPAAYAQLMGLTPAEGAAGAAGGGAEEDGEGGGQQGLPANNSQLSGTKRPSSAAEVASKQGPGFVDFEGEEGDGEVGEGEGEMMLVSPGPASAPPTASWRHQPPAAAAAKQASQQDLMPDVRSLADALEQPPAVVDLQNAVGNRVTLRLAGGHSVRVALPFAPTGPLAKAGLEALRAVLPGETWWALYARWLRTAGSCSGDAEQQWQALARVVLAWAADPAALGAQDDAAVRPRLPRPSGASSDTTTTTATATPRRQHSATAAGAARDGPAAWQHLLRSDHHRRHGARFAWAAQLQLPDHQQQQQQQGASAVAAAGGRDEVWRALQALHAVYEDCKMSVLRWQLLPALGATLLRLSCLLGATAHADHYCRDLGLPANPAASSVSSSSSSSSAAVAAAAAAAVGSAAGDTSGHSGGSSSGAATAAAPPPADMFRALQQLLQGQPDGGGAAPLLAQQRAGCVQRSADLLAAYSLLAEAVAGLTSGAAGGSLQGAQAGDLLEGVAHRIVRLLVRSRWTLADLDSLPFGVALPLRQAIQHCRSTPPTDWPQEAYVLIGRNDIAASMAAAEQEARPAEAAVSSIVSTPLGKMAKTTSPKKPPRSQLGAQMQQQGGGQGAGAGAGAAGGATLQAQLGAAAAAGGAQMMQTPTGGTTPPAGFSRLGPLGMAATPPLASATRHHPTQGGPGGPGRGAGGAGGSLLAAPEGEGGRVLAAPELLPVPYTHRLQLPVAAGEGTAVEGAGGEGGGAAAGAPASGAGAAALAGDSESGDGMDNLTQQVASLRFGRDLRLLEVRRLLRSSTPVALRMGNVQEPSDTEWTAAQQLKLTVLAIRTCALPLGRGALTLGTLRPLPTEPLHIPTLCLAGRLPEQNNAVVNLDFTGAAPAAGGGAFAEQTAWPEFHNGVAAGLRLAPGTHQLTRTWVVYNKPAEPSYTHAGMLMALGLTGHLSCLAATDLYRYLAQEHDATIIGVLLGMAASKRGSQDATISKTLFLHLPTRHPSSYPELDISPLVQAAALAGVGLLFQGTCHRVMAEVMLEEIGRRPGAGSKEEQEGAAGGQAAAAGLHKGVTRDREGYALAAGFALGLITLGRGRAAVGLADLHLEEKLRYFMVGGAPSGTVGTHQGLAAAGGQAPCPGDGVFGPGVIGFDPTLGEPEPRHGPLPRSNGSGARAPGSVAEELAAAQGSSQVVLEGELLNLGVTSPAAALALGLMYLQTNDAAVAAAFHLPDTHFALDFVQPEQLALRTLMRSLVMWDSIQPTEEWLLAQLPPLLKGPLSKFMAGEGAGVPNADYEALTQSHCCVLAGACLAVGVRFAGSANARAEALLRKYAQYFLTAKQRAPEPGTGQPSPTNRDLLEEALGSVLLALGVVMAGSGHLPTFKLLRALRKRLAPATLSNATQPSPAAPPTSSLNYGSHCAVSMALGFLFMGAGTLTFGTSPEAVAALLISLFPRLPSSTMDHRCHLQAFRHLYVLAAQPRSVDAIDVDTKQAVYVPLQITLNDPSGASSASSAAAAGRFASVLRPVASVSKGAGDVLAELAAQSADAAAAPGHAFLFDEQEGAEGPGGTAGAGTAGALGRQGAGRGVTFDRIAPCLLPEREQVAAVRVTGPRYWHQLLERRGASSSSGGGTRGGAAGSSGGGGHGPSLAALYATRTLFVQRKAGALPYADDPSGVRSLLSRMVHHQGGGGPGGGDPSFDLVHLCSTFGSDPFVMSFAQLFCGGDANDAAGGFRSRLPAAAATFRDFCRGALYECITGEKPAALPTYLLLYCIKQGLAQGGGSGSLAQLWGGLPPAVPLRSLALGLAYQDSGLGLAGADAQAAALRQGAGGEAAAQQWEPVVSPLLLQAAWQALEEAWAHGDVAGGEALRRYVATSALAAPAAAEEGQARGTGDEVGSHEEDKHTTAAAAAAAAAGQLGAYLQLHGVPASGALQAAAVQVQDMLRGAGLRDAGAAAAAAAAMLAATHCGLALPAAQAIAAALLH